MYNHKRYKEAWGRQQPIDVDQILQREEEKRQQTMQMQGIQEEDKTLEELEAELAEMEQSLGFASNQNPLFKSAVGTQERSILDYLKRLKTQFGNLDESCKVCGTYSSYKRQLKALIDQKKQQV